MTLFFHGPQAVSIHVVLVFDMQGLGVFPFVYAGIVIGGSSLQVYQRVILVTSVRVKTERNILGT